METAYIDIPTKKWGILLIYDFDMLDWDDMSAIMQSFGMPLRRVQHAIRVLSTYNSGLAISNDDLRMSAIFIGKPTSNAQWWNSLAHECKHVVDAIISYYDEPNDGESAAYLQGYIFQKIVEEIAEPCKQAF